MKEVIINGKVYNIIKIDFGYQLVVTEPTCEVVTIIAAGTLDFCMVMLNNIKSTYESTVQPVFHHTALTPGYVSNKLTDGIKTPYSGRFGTGYTIKRHNPDSTRYCFIDYYTFQ